MGFSGTTIVQRCLPLKTYKVVCSFFSGILLKICKSPDKEKPVGQQETRKHESNILKGQCHKIFCFRLFHESSSPKPLKIILRSFQIFSKFAVVFASQGAPPVSTTKANFATVALGVVDKGGKFATIVDDPARCL